MCVNQISMIGLATLAMLLGACAEKTDDQGLEQTRRPNIILVMTDDQGYGDLGMHDNPIVKTPQIDQLASQSHRFTNFHVDPTCSPTRAALMSGKYSLRAGVWHTDQCLHRLLVLRTGEAGVLRRPIAAFRRHVKQRLCVLKCVTIRHC